MFSQVKKITFSAMLVALGIIIPMIMPIKIMVEPVSFTLASHVPIFMSMFISPGAAVAVAIGTGIGFVLTAPISIALRAFSHIVFAFIGAVILQKNPDILLSKKKNFIFNGFIGIIHSLMELVVVTVLFFNHSLPNASYNTGYLTTMLLVLGIGGFLHSVIDYYIAFYVAEKISKAFTLPAFYAAVENR